VRYGEKASEQALEAKKPYVAD